MQEKNDLTQSLRQIKQAALALEKEKENLLQQLKQRQQQAKESLRKRAVILKASQARLNRLRVAQQRIDDSDHQIPLLAGDIEDPRIRNLALQEIRAEQARETKQERLAKKEVVGNGGFLFRNNRTEDAASRIR